MHTCMLLLLLSCCPATGTSNVDMFFPLLPRIHLYVEIRDLGIYGRNLARSSEVIVVGHGRQDGELQIGGLGVARRRPELFGGLRDQRLYNNAFKDGLLRKQRSGGQRARTVLQPPFKIQSLPSGGEASANASDAPSIAGSRSGPLADLTVVLAKAVLHIDAAADIEAA